MAPAMPGESSATTLIVTEHNNVVQIARNDVYGRRFLFDVSFKY